MVASADQLARVCDLLMDAPVVGVDTEFERTRTFYARPALVQLSDGTTSWLVDPLALADLAPLGRLLGSARTTKVLHACGEDLEVLERLTGARPTPLLDTQVAAAFAGFGASLGYRALVERLLGVALPDDQARSDWLRRPLVPRQLEYAAGDTVHLVPLHDRLQARLAELDRATWCAEDCARIARTAGSAPEPEHYHLRLRRATDLDPRSRFVLQRLCAWRELEARRRDVARKFVADDASLVEIARRAPDTLEALAGVESLHPRQRSRYGRELLGIAAAAREVPGAQLPAAPLRLDEGVAARAVRKVREVVRRRARAMDLPPEVLAPRRVIEALVERRASGSTELPDELSGWRRPVVVESLAPVLDALFA